MHITCKTYNLSMYIGFTNEQGQYDEYIWQKEDIAIVVLFKVTLFPCHSLMTAVS